MLYDSLKILHIISATLLLTGAFYCVNLWRKSSEIALEQIQTHTWLVILPFALLQLATGFTMISLKHYELSSLWIEGSVIGFIVVILSWFTFLYFLSAIVVDQKQQQYRRLQTAALSLGTTALLIMIYLMANKVT